MQFEECSIVIDSDEDMDEGFSCLLKGNTKGTKSYEVKRGMYKIIDDNRS